MNPAPLALLTSHDMAALFGPGQAHTKSASIALADGRQIQTSGTFTRSTVRSAVGRVGGSTFAATFTFPDAQCEDVAQGDAIRVDDTDYAVQNVATSSVGITTLTLRRPS